MQLNRIDVWCRDLGITGDARKLFILFAESGEATLEQMIDCLHGEKPDGGPLTADKGTRVTLWKLRKLLEGRAEISRRSLWEFKLNAVRDD